MVAEAGAVRPPRKPDRRVAVALSVMPGLGQLYNAQPRKALFYLLTTLLTVGPAVLLIANGERIGRGLLDRRAYTLFFVVAFVSVLVFIALFLLGLYYWASAAADAWRSAQAISAGEPDEAARRRFFRL